MRPFLTSAFDKFTESNPLSCMNRDLSESNQAGLRAIVGLTGACLAISPAVRFGDNRPLEV